MELVPVWGNAYPFGTILCWFSSYFVWHLFERKTLPLLREVGGDALNGHHLWSAPFAILPCLGKKRVRDTSIVQLLETSMGFPGQQTPSKPMVSPSTPSNQWIAESGCFPPASCPAAAGRPPGRAAAPAAAPPARPFPRRPAPRGARGPELPTKKPRFWNTGVLLADMAVVVKSRVTPKWNHGKWKHGLKPAGFLVV